MTMDTLLGAQLWTHDGVGDTAATLDGKKAVLLYFAAERCHLCREFTPLLAMAYSSYAEDDVEVVRRSEPSSAVSSHIVCGR